MAEKQQLKQDELISILRDGSRPLELRKKALSQLAEAESREAVMAIEEATNSSDEALRFYARRAMKRLDGLFAGFAAEETSPELPQESEAEEISAADSSQEEEEAAPEPFIETQGEEEETVTEDLPQEEPESSSDESDYQTQDQTPEADTLEPAARQFLEEISSEGNVGKLVYRIQMAGELEDPSFIAPLRIFLQKSENPQVVATIISVFGTFDEPELSQVIIPFLSHSDSRVRANAIEALGEIGDQGSIEHIVPFMEDSDNRIKANAAKALWKFDDSLVMEVLSSMVSSSSEGMRISAAHALARINSDESRKLLQNLASAKGEVGAIARENLEEIDNRDRQRIDRTARLKAIIGEEEVAAGSTEGSSAASKGDSRERSSKKSKKQRQSKDSSASQTATGRPRKGFFRRLVEIAVILLLLAAGTGAALYQYHPPARQQMMAWLDRTLLSLAGVEQRDPSQVIASNETPVAEPPAVQTPVVPADKPASAVAASENRAVKPAKPAAESATSGRANTPSVSASVSEPVKASAKAPEKAQTVAAVKTPEPKPAAPSVSPAKVDEAKPPQQSAAVRPVAEAAATSAASTVPAQPSAVPAPQKEPQKEPQKVPEKATVTAPAAVSQPTPVSVPLAESGAAAAGLTGKKDDPMAPLPGLKGEVQKVYIDMTAAYNKKSLDDYMGLYDSAYTYLGNNADTVRKVIAEEFSFGPELVMSIDTIDITVRDTTARVKVSYFYCGKTVTGVELDREFSLTARTDTLIKENGKWRIRHSE